MRHRQFLWFLGLWVWFAATALGSMVAFAYGEPSPPRITVFLTRGYDGRTGGKTAYDCACPAAFDYDGTTLLRRSGEQTKRLVSIDGSTRFRPSFAEGLAAKTIDPALVRFSQSSISRNFSSGGAIENLAAGLRNGPVNPANIPPIRLVEREGNLISIDNRRLEAFRRAETQIPYRMATPAEIQQAIRQGKFSAGELGSETIRVRGQ